MLNARTARDRRRAGHPSMAAFRRLAFEGVHTSGQENLASELHRVHIDIVPRQRDRHEGHVTAAICIEPGSCI